MSHESLGFIPIRVVLLFRRKVIFQYKEANHHILKVTLSLLSYYLSPNIVKGIKSTTLRWAGHLVRMEEFRNVCKILRPRHRTEDNFTTYLKEISVNMRNWVDSAEDGDYWGTLMSAELNLQVS